MEDCGLFLSCSKAEIHFAVIHDSCCGHIWFPYRSMDDIGVCAWCWEGDGSSIHKRCKFPVTSLLRPGAVVPPTFCWLCLLLRSGDTIGCYGVILAMIGPRTTQELISPFQAVNSLFGYMYAVVGLRTVLEWGWGLGLLEKPGVFGNETDRARGLSFFSTIPE